MTPLTPCLTMKYIYTPPCYVIGFPRTRRSSDDPPYTLSNHEIYISPPLLCPRFPPHEEEFWERVRLLRNDVNGCLEEARRAKVREGDRVEGWKGDRGEGR